RRSEQRRSCRDRLYRRARRQRRGHYPVGCDGILRWRRELGSEIHDVLLDPIRPAGRGYTRKRRYWAALQQLCPRDGRPRGGHTQHLLTTTDDFVTTNDVTLASESN